MLQGFYKIVALILKYEKTFVSDKSQEVAKMGSRMNPECKIYIGGLPDDANK